MTESCYKNLYKTATGYTIITYALFCDDITYIIVINYDPANQYLHINISKQIFIPEEPYGIKAGDKVISEANNILRMFFLLVEFYKKNHSCAYSSYIKETTGNICNVKTYTIFSVRENNSKEPYQRNTTALCIPQSSSFPIVEDAIDTHISKHAYYRLARLYNYFYNYIKMLV